MTLSLTVTAFTSAFTSASHRTQSLPQRSRASISDVVSRSALLSTTQRSDSMTPSLYCALRRDAAAGGAVGVLHDMKSTTISSVVTLMPSSPTPVGGASAEWIWAAPVSRSDLLEGLPLAMNLSINAAASEWNVYQVEVFTGTNGADDTRIGDVAEFNVIDNNVTVLQQGTQQLLVVSPPSNRWLPASTSTFVSTNIVLRVTLQCSPLADAR